MIVSWLRNWQFRGEGIMTLIDIMALLNASAIK